jgi:hypothetical protein
MRVNDVHVGLVLLEDPERTDDYLAQFLTPA